MTDFADKLKAALDRASDSADRLEAAIDKEQQAQAERLAALHELETDMRSRPGDHSDLLRVVSILKDMNK